MSPREKGGKNFRFGKIVVIIAFRFRQCSDLCGHTQGMLCVIEA